MGVSLAYEKKFKNSTYYKICDIIDVTFYKTNFRVDAVKSILDENII